ncbi:MAG: DUF222 domain-containing protein [Acidimicrobiaceae bacterium]|nr:DUF222 domain-containing protein [Acidimicrobiaceae bacterium]
MLISITEQVDKSLAEMLICVRSGRVSIGEVRDALTLSKSVSSRLVAFQTAAAAVVSRVEGHGDDGVGVLRNSIGVSKREASRKVQTAGELRKLPKVSDAVDEGKISFGNADALAKASRDVNPEAVQEDSVLLAEAEVMPEDRFARRVRRWAAQRQRDRGEADFARKRARRSVRVWDGDDGMTHLKGEFDPVTGARIRSRLNEVALLFYRGDKKQAVNTTNRRSVGNSVVWGDGLGVGGDVSGDSGVGVVGDSGSVNGAAGGGGGINVAGLGGSQRSFEQCSADALEQLITTFGPLSSKPHKSKRIMRDSSDTEVVAGEGNGIGGGGTGFNGSVASSGGGCNCGISSGIGSRPTAEVLVFADISTFKRDKAGSGTLGSGTSSNAGESSGGGGSPGGLIEVMGAGPIPPSVFDRLMCDARVTGLLFDGPGRPLWCGRSKRTVNAAQLKALRLRDRECVGCGADPSMCQAHHIVPWAQGGKTDIESLVLVCYQCHHKIHENNWQIIREPTGAKPYRLVEPCSKDLV